MFEFLMVGGLTLVFIPVGLALRGLWGVETSAFWVSFVAFYGAILINDPHFAATYLLFYSRPKQRLLGDEWPRGQRFRYLAAGFVIPLGLCFWGLYGLWLRSNQALGVLFQLMFLLVSWHYVKQGFGVLVTLSAQRGVRFSLMERRAVLAHCFAGWGYAWSRRAAAGGRFSEKGVIYDAWPHPEWLEPLALTCFGASALALAYVLLAKWRRQRIFPPAGALCGLLVSVWVWTVFSELDPLLVYLVPAFHSLQYLYFVGWLRLQEARARSGPPWFLAPGRRLAVFAFSAVALGFVMMRASGDVLDTVFQSKELVYGETTWQMGETPFLAVVVTIVNIHHYFMDNVIWRRDNPETRSLFAAPSAP